jgi:hypothetical protein
MTILRDGFEGQRVTNRVAGRDRERRIISIPLDGLHRFHMKRELLG